jgi:hypothetical protein
MIRSVQLDLHSGICMIQRFKNKQKGNKEKWVRTESCCNFLCVDNNFLELFKQCILYQIIMLSKYIIWLKCNGNELPKVHEQYLLFIISCSHCVYSHIRVHFYDLYEQHTIGSKLSSICFDSLSHAVLKVTLTKSYSCSREILLYSQAAISKNDNEWVI